MRHWRTFPTAAALGLLVWVGLRAAAQGPPPATRPTLALEPGERQLDVTIAGGHDTDRRDGGRPVTLVAAGLGVPADAFRETFTHVHPAGENQQPTGDRARENKAALMAGLAKYGVTNNRLDEVSNHYRYARGRDKLWRHRPAVAAAVERDGKVVEVRIIDAGAGYTAEPTVTVAGHPEVTVHVTLKFGTDLATNGSVATLSLTRPASRP